MLLRAEIQDKKMGSKHLFSGLDLIIQDNEKLAIIGRNGVGKTTLFRMLAGEDTHFQGDIQLRRGASLVMTAQEHTDMIDTSCLDYILHSQPDYSRLHHIIETFPETMGSDLELIGQYTDALTRFEELGYYLIEQKVITALENYQIAPAQSQGPLRKLSGGQKRFVELVKVTQANADLALIDEPTNHMDYVGKAAFIEWLRSAQGSVVIITHDRDVLKEVDRIVEIKDKKVQSFNGNYDAYLRQNSVSTVTQIDQYEVAQRTLENLHKQIQAARAKKASTSKTPNPFVTLERRLQKQYDELKARVSKPSFWVDQESVNQMSSKVVEKYDRYKDRNIRISTVSGETTHHQTKLLEVWKLSLGYGSPLFSDLSFSLLAGDRIQIRGRNGAGKTTLIQAIRSQIEGTTTEVKWVAGSVDINPKLRLGVYEQEPSPELLQLPLGRAVTKVYEERGVAVNDQRVRRVLADYLFDPVTDFQLTLDRLSGGQRARFQIISMLCHQPTLLILDEPTNHLDLPSIEELEKALERYEGSIIYVSHDSYFVSKIGGQVVQIGAD